jgi:hypothetical protein
MPPVAVMPLVGAEGTAAADMLQAAVAARARRPSAAAVAGRMSAAAAVVAVRVT